MHAILDAYRRHRFLFTELVKRDFKKKYKRTYLGVLWSLLSPLLSLCVMYVVFSQFFGRDSANIKDYLIYLFCGNVIWAYFSDATNRGMSSLMDNAEIFSKINVPKYLFLFSSNVSSLINFGMTLIIFFLFVIIRQIPFTFYFFLLVIPILCLIVFNMGMGLILSALYVFFRDVQYLWSVFLTLLMYLSAIFYDPSTIQLELFGKTLDGATLWMLNPVYDYIKYFRVVVLDGTVPSWELHALCIGYAAVAMLVGLLIYKTKNHKFLYYI